MARSKESLGELIKELQEPLERVAQGYERVAQSLEKLDSRLADSPPPVSGDPFTRHIRRYVPFYAIALAWALMLVLLPTVNQRQRVSTTPGGESGGTTIEIGPEGDVTVTGDAPGATGFTTGGTATGGRRVATGTGAVAVGQSIDVAKSLTGRGTTRAGFACDPTTRQVPWSEYASPCIGKFDGDNGGPTFRGVTKDRVTVVYRQYPDSSNQQAVDAFLAQAGFASREVEDNTMNEMIPWFNKTFELWGRSVQIVKYSNPAANGTDEVQGRGREQACVDAQRISQDVKGFVAAFAAGSEQFVDCAKDYQLGHTSAAAYYAETYYKKWHPYASHRVMQCERIARQVAEYVGKRLAFKPARWAGQLDLQRSQRKIGTYVPDNEGYQLCVRLYQDILVSEYGFDRQQLKNDTFNYTLDISRFPDMAAQAILRFKAAGVTTITLACDQVSMVLLTQAARQQNYFPEWLLIGVASTDLDQWANLTDQEETVGHLFGMSQLGHTQTIFARDGEMNRSYKAATGKDLPTGATARYWELLHLFGAIQMAGPNLNYHTMMAGLQSYPLSGLKLAPVGRWSWATSHTAIVDSKEIYWTAPDKDNATSNGTYRVTYNARRFTDGEWPVEEPPVYPGGKTN